MYTVTVIDNTQGIKVVQDGPVESGVMVAGHELGQMMNRYKVMKAGIKKEEERASLLRGKICEVIGEADTVCDAEGLVIGTYKTPADSMRFDTDLFKAEHPELYEKYLKVQEGARRLVVK